MKTIALTIAAVALLTASAAHADTPVRHRYSVTTGPASAFDPKDYKPPATRQMTGCPVHADMPANPFPLRGARANGDGNRYSQAEWVCVWHYWGPWALPK